MQSPHSQLLQHIQNSVARAVVQAPLQVLSHHSYSQISPLAKVNERIEYKILSLSHTRLSPPLNLQIFIA